MNNVLLSVFFAIFLLVGMLVLLEIGWRTGARHRMSRDRAQAGLGAVDGAIFALLGLLIAFTFSGAATRFDSRRALIIEETNNIGTAWLRLDLLHDGPRAKLRETFRRYVDSRLAVYRQSVDFADAREALNRSNAIQTEIWNEAVAATKEEGIPPSASMLLLPALNAMFDITTVRTAAIQTHPPWIIFAMLAMLAFVSSLLAGYGMAGSKLRSWMHMISFALIMSVSVYVILDLEFPRLGLIRIDNFDQFLVSLRQSMN